MNVLGLNGGLRLGYQDISPALFPYGEIIAAAILFEQENDKWV